jgi:hypothetical protein
MLKMETIVTLKDRWFEYRRLCELANTAYKTYMDWLNERIPEGLRTGLDHCKVCGIKRWIPKSWIVRVDRVFFCSNKCYKIKDDENKQVIIEHLKKKGKLNILESKPKSCDDSLQARIIYVTASPPNFHDFFNREVKFTETALREIEQYRLGRFDNLIPKLSEHEKLAIRQGKMKIKK